MSSPRRAPKRSAESEDAARTVAYRPRPTVLCRVPECPTPRCHEHRVAERPEGKERYAVVGDKALLDLTAKFEGPLVDIETKRFETDRLEVALAAQSGGWWRRTKVRRRAVKEIIHHG